MGEGRQRIRYVPSPGNGDGFIESMRMWSIKDGRDVKVVINTMTHEYVIVSMVDGVTVAQGNSTYLPGTKINAKRALAALGVVFDDEARERDR